MQARLWLAPGLGPDYLEAVYRQMDLQLVGTEEDTVLAEGVARGKWDFGLFGGGNTFQQMQNENLPVAELTAQRVLEPGLSTEITYGPAVTERAPHPNAAKLFINWYFSREGQTASQLSRAAEGPQFSTSMRSDVPQGSIPDYLYENVEQIPEWRAAGTMDEHVIVYETNDEWFAVRDAQEKFFNDLYIELGYDAWVNY